MMWTSGSYAHDVLKAARAWDEARRRLEEMTEQNSFGEDRNSAYGDLLHAERDLAAAVTKHRSIDV